jgi:hypothetical protein
MVVAFVLAATETVMYFAAISNLPSDGFITYPRLLNVAVNARPVDCLVILGTNLLFSVFLVARVRDMKSDPSGWWVSAFEGIILGHFVSRFAMGIKTTKLWEGVAITAVGVAIGMVPPVSAWLFGAAHAIPFAVVVAAALWLTAFLIVIERYIREGELHSADTLRNYGYYKDGILLLALLVLLAYVPWLARESSVGSVPLMILAVGAGIVGVLTVLWELRFSSTPQGKHYAERLLRQAKRSRDTDLEEMIALIDWHVMIRSGFLLLLGVVGCFFGEMLKRALS